MQPLRDQPGEDRRDEAFEARALLVDEGLVLVHDLLDSCHLGPQQSPLAARGIERHGIKGGRLLVVVDGCSENNVAGQAFVALVRVVDQRLVGGNYGPPRLQHLGEAQGEVDLLLVVRSHFTRNSHDSTRDCNGCHHEQPERRRRPGRVDASCPRRSGRSLDRHV